MRSGDLKYPEFSWTPENVDLLRRLQAGGATFSIIAEQLGTTRCAIAGKTRRLGLCKFTANLYKTKPNARGPRGPTGGPRNATTIANRILNARLKRAPQPPPIVSEPNPESHVTMMALTLTACRYVVGEPNGIDTVYCGSQVWGEWESYCGFHHHITHAVPR